ncbi:hypothetical protein CJ010_04565 [Azoarcus sp. DD4]|uniref:SPOR domain-containing protein n=1 Tax=Azoarcus sp. DD4 TaxID=2027405 RepID=UPI00112D73F3|nr:SPOR domain-containing protein [Azoarcus sp. DD4]QDF95868.1 hypothetical protein CJ010_04565 [Azoarcus sp. DD4]
MALMRLFLILLLVLNALAFAAIQGWLGSTPPQGEPERVGNQLHPERIRFATDSVTELPTPPAGGDTPPGAPSEQASPTPALDRAATAQADTPDPAAEQPCVAWSGLGTDEANRLVARLQAAAINARQISIDTPNSWWVRVPPQGGREQAERKVKELKALGVSDFFIVQDAGPNQFAISLGLFKTEAAANQQLAQLRNKGVRSAGVAPRMSTQYRVEANASAERLTSFTNADTRLDAARGTCQP